MVVTNPFITLIWRMDIFDCEVSSAGSQGNTQVGTENGPAWWCWSESFNCHMQDLMGFACFASYNEYLWKFWHKYMIGMSLHFVWQWTWFICRVWSVLVLVSGVTSFILKRKHGRCFLSHTTPTRPGIPLSKNQKHVGFKWTMFDQHPRQQ